MLLLMDYKCNVRQNKIKGDQQNTNYLHIAHSFFDLDKVEIEHLTSATLLSSRVKFLLNDLSFNKEKIV